MMLRQRWMGILVIVAMAGALAGRAEAQATTRPTQATQSTTFLRFIENEDGSARLESADAAYRNSAGVDVHLIGAVHIADPIYYQGLNESFRWYDALLYEMVKPKDAGVPRPGAPSHHWIGMVQHFMKDRLGLEFQLDGIDYTRPNFVHADLDAETFAKMQDERGESFLTLMFRSALHDMARGASSAGEAGDPMAGLEILAALGSPDQARQLKLVLARQFGNIDEQMSGMEGAGGSVLITERNKAAFRTLKQQIAAGKRHLAIFYGAGHLKGMEQMLLDMGFHKVGITWRTAWDIAPAPPAPPAPSKSASRPASAPAGAVTP